MPVKCSEYVTRNAYYLLSALFFISLLLYIILPVGHAVILRVASFRQEGGYRRVLSGDTEW